MEYIKHTENGFILSVQNNAPKGTGNCTAEEYYAIVALVKTAPVPPEGYEYRLTEGRTLELYPHPAAEGETVWQAEF